MLVCDSLDVIEDNIGLMRNAKPAIGRINQEGFAVNKDTSTIVIDCPIPKVRIQMNIEGLKIDVAGQGNEQLGVFLAVKGFVWIIPCSEDLLSGARSAAMGS